MNTVWVMYERKQFQDHFLITSSSRLCFAFSSRSHLRKLATIYASACCSSTSLPHFLPISLNSLDRKGTRLLSPCGAQITITPDAGPADSAPGDAYELKWELDEDRVRCVVSFPVDQ